MNILLIGSGGREHAIAWKLANSNKVNKIFVTPGNAGTAQLDKCSNIAIKTEDINSLIEFAKNNNILYTVVGPEAPLMAGIVDEFNAHNLNCFGPKKEAALLEGSKSFAKDFFKKFNIPTANYGTFVNYEDAISFLKTQDMPIVIKKDGLHAGKGVTICNSLSEAANLVAELLTDKSLPCPIVIEEFLTGVELSYTVLTDGNSIVPVASSQDHKKRDNNNMGPNTGGMGAISPSPWCTKELEQEILNKIIKPTVQGMQSLNINYSGVLYAGIMLTNNGPKILEYNCRFGDPETQAIIPRLQTDFVDVLEAYHSGNLVNCKLNWSDNYALNVVIAANGYPGKYLTGSDISHITKINSNSIIFHAGTKLVGNNIQTTGGRVISVTAYGDSIKNAKLNAYDTVSNIIWDGAFCRTDIGAEAIAHQACQATLTT